MVTSNRMAGLCRLPCPGLSPWISPCPDAWEYLLHSPRHQGHPGSHLVLGSAEWTGGLGWPEIMYFQKLCDGTDQVPLLQHHPSPWPFSALQARPFSLPCYGALLPLCLSSPHSPSLESLSHHPQVASSNAMFHKAFLDAPSSHALSFF